MNQQNMSTTPNLPMKRKRGRPRKDENRQAQTPVTPPVVAPAPPPAAVKTIQPPLPPTATNNLNDIDHSLVGQAVTCIIDGIFDNGYLLSTRMGPNNSILRGIVFQQGHVSPVTPTNDVAPHVEMMTRGEFTIPPSDPRNHTQFCTPHSICEKQPMQPVAIQDYQTTPPMVTGGSGTCAPHENLRMIEQDDVMQVFEVSKTVEQDKNEIDPTAEHLPKCVVSDRTAENDSSPNEHHVKQPGGEKPELITSVETVIKNQPLMGNDESQQESEEQKGEASKVDNANQDLSQAVAVDFL